MANRQIGTASSIENILLSDISKQIDRLTQVIAGGGGGSGTVTSVSVVTTNGFAGSVATATTTPAITISTTITGLLKGNGTAISAAVAGTDYLAPNGSGAALTGVYLLASGGTASGPNTYVGTTTNIFKYTFDTLGTTQTNGAGNWFANTTAAAAGAQQRSPSLVLEGQGWKTTATAASQSVKFLMDVLPVQGTTAPTGTFGIYPSVNGAAYSSTPALSIDTTGATRIAFAGNDVEGFYYGTPASRRISMKLNDSSAISYLQGLSSTSTVVWHIGSIGALTTLGLTTDSITSGWLIRNNSGDTLITSILSIAGSSVTNSLQPTNTTERSAITSSLAYNPSSGGNAILNFLKYSGTWTDISSGTAAMTVFDLNHTINTTTGSRPTYALRYRPTITATAGAQYFIIDETTGARSGLGVAAPTATLHLRAGTATASTAPLKLTSGTNLTTAENGAFEYNGTNLFFTRTGAVRENIITTSAVNVVSPTAPNRTLTIVIDGTTYYLHAKTTND